YEAAKAAGLVDTKVVAFSKTHTAHKCVIPVEMRGVALRRPPIVSIPPSAPVVTPKRASVKPPAAASAKKPAAKKAEAKKAPAKAKKPAAKPAKRKK